jgi:hypothetical protein
MLLLDRNILQFENRIKRSIINAPISILVASPKKTGSLHPPLIITNCRKL